MFIDGCVVPYGLIGIVLESLAVLPGVHVFIVLLIVSVLPTANPITIWLLEEN